MSLTDIFSSVLNMSLTASVVILAVCLARVALKYAPKIYSYLLWALVLFRLLCPVSLLSPFSLIPDPISSGEAVSQWSDDYIGDIQIHHDNRTEYAAAVEAGREPISAGEDHYYVVTASDGISEPKTVENTLMPLLAKVWIGGIVALILHSILSYARVRKQTRVAVSFRKGVYLADDVTSPFVMGLFRPVIYLPGSLGPWERTFIIAHERHHIRRGDHIFKALGFLALTVHWFNPLVWLAFTLASRDMEMSCDEAVIRKLGEDVRAEYSASLLNLATGKRMFTGTPLAFDEGDPTARVRNLAKWKKPKRWIILFCVLLCIVLAVCLLTDPKDEFDWSLTRQEGASCALGDFNYTVPEAMAVQGMEVEHDGNAWDYGNVLYIGDTVVGGVVLRYQELENAPEMFTAQWQKAIGIPEASDRAMHAATGTVEETYCEITYTPDATAGGDEVTHHFFVNGTHVYDLWFYSDLVPEDMQTELLSSAYIEPEAAASDWGISLVPENVSRTGATATFAYPAAMPGYENAELTYGDFLSLERLENGKWVEVEEQPGYEYYVGDSSYPVSDGYGMVHEWEVRFGELPDGHYRLGKKVTMTHPNGDTDEQVIYGEFFLPDSILTGPVPLEELPEKYSAEQAMLDGCFVQSDGVARENKELFHQFATVTAGGIPSSIRIVNWYYGDDPHYTAMDLSYDGSVYTVSWLEDGQPYFKQFRYLKHFIGKKERENMAYDAYEHYVLVNDDSATWFGIWSGLISSQQSTSVDFMIVYSDYSYYGERVKLPKELSQAVLEFEGEPLITVTDFDRLEKLYLLFDGAEFLGYEPKTHSIGIGLNLILTSQNGETVTIELDPDEDICRIGDEYVFYGAPDEPSYVEKLWYYLGISQWPEKVYEQYPNVNKP